MDYVRVFALALALCGAGGKATVHRAVEEDGEGNDNLRYPYVGAFILRNHRSLSAKNARGCTGSIIAPEWVLTAGHCLDASLINEYYFAYGDLSLPLHKSEKLKKVIRGVTSFYDQFGMAFKNDIGLAMIETARLKVYAKISSLDYNSLIGYPVEYAGAGTASKAILKSEKEYRQALYEDQTRPLQVGRAVITKCDKIRFQPAICIRPKCSAKKQRVTFGDSGGPLFYNEKIIAVTSKGEDHTEVVLSQFTPVSPFLDWIKDTVNNTGKTD